MTLCSKPSCARPGAVVLAYDYATRVASLHDPDPGEVDPHLYVLCSVCADRLSMPRGWTLDDRRNTPPMFLEDRREVVRAL